MLKKILILTTAIAYVVSVPAMAATAASVAPKSVSTASSHATVGKATKVADATSSDTGAKKKVAKKKKKKKAAPAAG